MGSPSDLTRLSGQQGPGVQLPPIPMVPFPASVLKMFPELAQWQEQNAALWAVWLRQVTANIQA